MPLKTHRVPPGGYFEHGTHIPYRRSLFLVPSAFEGVGKGAAGDKFRVSGTKEMVEGAGANKESEVLSHRGKLLPLRNFELHKRKRSTVEVDLLWELRESNPRPSACKADALNQLS